MNFDYTDISYNLLQKQNKEIIFCNVHEPRLIYTWIFNFIIGDFRKSITRNVFKDIQILIDGSTHKNLC